MSCNRLGRSLVRVLGTLLLAAGFGAGLGGCRAGVAVLDPSATVEQIAFTSGFDSPLWFLGWGRRKPPVNTTLVTRDDALGFAPFRGPALRIKIAEGSHAGPVDLEMPLEIILGYEPDEIYFRYYLRFAEDWAPESSGKLPGVAGTYGRAGWGGRPANGRNGWSARAHFRPSRQGKTDYGFYVYHADMTRQHGDAWSWGVPLERNRWYCIEQHVKLNTPGKNDGILQGWIDGVLSCDRRDVRLRDVPELKIEKIWMDVYYGGSKVPPRDMHLYVDEVVVARRRIGCRSPEPTP
ncbi:MAG: hypothetical protein HKN62_06345 [Phycisphaerales bacterium]|nr:hypothetical protein [Phycisphaerales bacterium]